MPNNSTIKDYEALKNAIGEGAKKYLKAREEGKNPDKSYPYVGFFHGKQGIIRAKNVLACQQMNNMDNLSILALSTAIFNTSGTWLQTEIAYKLITGNYYEYLPTNRLDPQNEDTIASDAFHQYQLEKSMGWTAITINKLKTASNTLTNAVNEEFSQKYKYKSGNVEYHEFDDRVQAFGKILEAETELKEIDLNLATLTN